MARLPRHFRALAGVCLLIVVLTAIGAVASDRFRTPDNILNVLEQSTALALVSLGQTLAVLTGGIDLSVGSQISLSSVLLSGLTNSDPKMVFPVLAFILLLGVMIGLINAAGVVWLDVHPLIVTLGTGSILQGATLLYALGPAGGMPPEFNDFAYGQFLGLPVGSLLTIALFVLVAGYLRYFRLGRFVYAVGDDANAAQLMGIPRNRVLFVVYAFCGVTAALAAAFLVAKFGVGQPYTGQNYTLSSITPVVVGGTVLTGGRGALAGHCLGSTSFRC